MSANPALGSIELEQRVVGAVLVDNAQLDPIPYLKPEHFSDPLLGKIFALITRLIEAGRLASPETVWAGLQDNQAVADLGGESYLMRLAGNAAEGMAEEHGRVVYDLAIRRLASGIMREGIQSLIKADMTDSPAKLIEAIEDALVGLTMSRRFAAGFTHVESAIDEALAVTAEAYRNAGGIIGTPTGLRMVDDALGGLKDRTLTILAGRPGMGKSAIASSIALNVAKGGRTVAIFSLEMAGPEWAYRWLTDEAFHDGLRLEYSNVARGRVTPDEYQTLLRYGDRVKRLPIWIDDAGGATIGHIRSRVRALSRTLWRNEQKVGLVIVDHLGLAEADGRGRQQTTNDKVSEISRGLKFIAKEFCLPVLALSQLSRNVERRDDKRPQLADLRDSGSIEQDSDTVLFAYRPAYYLLQEKPENKASPEYADWRQKMREIEHDLDVIVAKQRQGRLGTHQLYVDLGANAIRDKDEGGDGLGGDGGWGPDFNDGGREGRGGRY